MQLSEKQFNTKATTDAFDEIYTSFDLSQQEEYLAENGYPFDYPTRWLNDPSMNKRVAIRRLDVTPSSHSFTLRVRAWINESLTDTDGDTQTPEYITSGPFTIDVTEYDNLIKVLNAMTNQFCYPQNIVEEGGLQYEYDNRTNILRLKFLNSKLEAVPFKILSNTDDPNDRVELTDFLKFLNQKVFLDEARGTYNDEAYNTCMQKTEEKIFKDVWNRDRIHFHATFSTSRRKFIGKRGDFYQTLSLLYPPPTNESTFYIRFTSNGIKNILLRYCEFDVQLCFIVNYRKANIL